MVKKENSIRLPKNVTLVKATYLKDYIYRFEFSNGKIFDTNFKPMLSRSLSYLLDVTKFKKMKINSYDRGDIYWGKNWDMCFHLELYYGKRVMIPSYKK